jgi:putative methionine-R-sulfoxide reductase with GAF domain
VLDLDSPMKERFSDEDRVGLERFVKRLLQEASSPSYKPIL